MIKFRNTYKDMQIKKFLQQIGLSSRTITQLAKKLGILSIDDKPKILIDSIKHNEILTIDYIDNSSSQNIPICTTKINVVYEDEYLLICDKPQNLPTTPNYRYKESLVGQVLNYLQSGTIRAMNRLDVDTTGCVVFAKNIIAENILRTNGTLKKYYLAIVEGKTQKKSSINANILDDENQHKRIISPKGLPAITYYKRKKYYKRKNLSLIECHLKYGRTNQIRCHMSYIGHPLQYDTKYDSKYNTQNFYLRCYKLNFVHPITNKKIKILLKPNLIV